ncbi:MAG: undecaprenyl-diphosphatase [Oligoflexia bacterium]|nr:MAG: undecaprenyl-diphosphatase [Oligoflexia bacterium]
MGFWEVLILSFIEGMTEYLPISSTGHLIITSALMGIQDEGFIKSFNVIIQFGAILSVLVLYWRRFLPDLNFYKKLIIGFLPAAVIGLLVKKKIDLILGSVQIVAWALIIGGILLIISDRIFSHQNTHGKKIEDLSWKDCLKIGLIQCFAFIPGVSRSAATILGGLSLGLNRRQAAEFSFFLAVPTLSGAALVKSLGLITTIESSQISWLLIGTGLSFIFALFAIKFFIELVSRFGFKHFGAYRIVLGIALLLFIYGGYI